MRKILFYSDFAWLFPVLFFLSLLCVPFHFFLSLQAYKFYAIMKMIFKLNIWCIFICMHTAYDDEMIGTHTDTHIHKGHYAKRHLYANRRALFSAFYRYINCCTVDKVKTWHTKNFNAQSVYSPRIRMYNVYGYSFDACVMHFQLQVG